MRNFGHPAVTSHRRPRAIVRPLEAGQLRAIFAAGPSRWAARSGLGSAARSRHVGRPVAARRIGGRLGSARWAGYGGERSWFAGRSTRSPGRSSRRRNPQRAGERESGGNPELSRSGERERTPSSALGAQPGKRRPVGRPRGRCPRVRRPAGCTGYAVSGGHRLEDWAPRSTSAENASVVRGGRGFQWCPCTRVRRWPVERQHWRTP